MFDFPAHDAQIVVKPFVGRPARTGHPCVYRWLLVKARRVRFDAKERDKILIALDPKLACRLERPPQPR